MQSIRVLAFCVAGRRAEVMAGLETPPKGLQDGLHSHSNCRCIYNQRALADPEEKKTCTFPGTLDQCHTTLAGNRSCIPKGALKTTPSLLTSFSPSQYKTVCVAKQKWGFSKPPAWDPLCCREGTGMLGGSFATHRNRSNTSASVIGCRELGDSNSPRAL